MHLVTKWDSNDRPLPRNLDFERRTLGTFMSAWPGQAARFVEAGFDERIFDQLAYRFAARAALVLASDGVTPDALLVWQEMGPSGQAEWGDNKAAFLSLPDGCPPLDLATCAYYVQSLQEFADARRNTEFYRRLSEDWRTVDGEDEHDALRARAREFARVVSTRDGDLLTDDAAICMRPEPEHYVEHLIGAGDIVGVVGASGAGKSHALLDLLFNTTITNGIWMGSRILRNGAALLAPLEGRRGVRGRVIAWKLHHECPLEHRLGLDFYNADLSLVDPGSVERFIRRALSIRDLVVIGIDTFAKAILPGKENDTTDSGLATKALERIQRETGATVVVTHHLVQDGSRERGNTAFRASCDQLFKLAVDSMGIRTLTHEKSRDFEQAVPVSFRLASVGPSCVPLVVEHRSENVSPDDGEDAVWRRMQRLLGHQPMTAVELAQALGVKVDTIDRTLRRKRDMFTKVDGSDGVARVVLSTQGAP